MVSSWPGQGEPDRDDFRGENSWNDPYYDEEYE
jgi:hypothetical protein